jgi:hypothetical protein
MSHHPSRADGVKDTDYRGLGGRQRHEALLATDPVLAAADAQVGLLKQLALQEATTVGLIHCSVAAGRQTASARLAFCVPEHLRTRWSHSLEPIHGGAGVNSAAWRAEQTVSSESKTYSV